MCRLLFLGTVSVWTTGCELERHWPGLLSGLSAALAGDSLLQGVMLQALSSGL